MAISFDEIGPNTLTPGAFVEFDGSLAEVGAGAFPLRGLIIAPKTTAGTLAVLTPQRVTSAEQASAYAGPGSMASRMAAAWFAVNQQTEVDLLLVADAGSGTPQTRTVTFGGTATPGAVAVYVAGDRFSVNTNQTTTDMAQALATAVTAAPESAMTAAASGSVVTLTALNAGTEGVYIDVRVSHGPQETIPAGVTVAVAAGQSGATSADVAPALAAIAGVQYDVLAHPWITATNLGAIEAELATRFDANSAIPGHAFTGITGNVAGLGAIGNTRNARHSSIVGMEVFPGVPYERAAAVAARVALHGSIDPARPFQTLALPGLTPLPEDRFSDAERNLLLLDGISTTKTDVAGPTTIGRLVTTNQTNAAGAPTAAFRDVNLLLLLAYYRKSFTAFILNKFPRAKLAADGGTPPAPGSKLVTPKAFQGEAVAHYKELRRRGLVEDLPGFIANSTYAINGTDPNRLDASVAPNFVNQFRVSATLVQFRL